MQNRPLPVKRIVPKAESEEARTLRMARIARQVREGTYYVSGRDIAAKFLLREQAALCG